MLNHVHISYGFVWKYWVALNPLVDETTSPSFTAFKWVENTGASLGRPTRVGFEVLGGHLRRDSMSGWNLAVLGWWLVSGMIPIWGFPQKIGVPPVIIHFEGIFSYKSSSYGVPPISRNLHKLGLSFGCFQKPWTPSQHGFQYSVMVIPDLRWFGGTPILGILRIFFGWLISQCQNLPVQVSRSTSTSFWQRGFDFHSNLLTHDVWISNGHGTNVDVLTMAKVALKPTHLLTFHPSVGLSTLNSRAWTASNVGRTAE